MDTVGKRLAYIRTNVLNISQIEMAKLLGTSQAGLSHVEADSRQLSSGMIERLAGLSLTYSEIDLLWLLTGENPNLSDFGQRLQLLDERGRMTVLACLEKQEELCQRKTPPLL